MENKRIRSQINCKLQGSFSMQWWAELRQFVLANRELVIMTITKTTEFKWKR